MMAGGEELDELAVELDLISKRDPGQAGDRAPGGGRAGVEKEKVKSDRC
jgi:hypothetical protein